ncbi:hypothetical protein GGS26DRAFT_562564 [Hypomontagnella submonticulosa]|nr:hypothetical protein GGS26DRAFT_562564 [Hypomontagnella submonticulosa]
MADQDNYSDIQQEVSADADIEPDPENVYRGHKANLSNPSEFDAIVFHTVHVHRGISVTSCLPGLDTSSAAKERSRKILENETGEPVDASNNVRGVRGGADSQEEHKDPGNV